MFRQYRWDVKSLLKPKNNDIQIKFPSTVRFAQALQAERKMQGVSQAIEGGPARAQGALPVWLGLGTDAAADRHLEGPAPGRLHRRAH